ncbi:MAG: LptF/LptG family permease [Planctomycetaceae bacterium]|nr:LptF/LptG family permease [Planctomycetaceae bacterium]
MLRIIDRYLLVQYLKTFFICWASLTGLYIVVDAFSNLDEFMKYAEESGRGLVTILAEFYTFRAIFFFDRASAILAMISAMFTITWIQRHNELTALMAAGLSRIRVVRPILIAAALITVGAAVSREFVIPQLRDQLTRDPKDLIGDATNEMNTQVDHESGVILKGQFTQAKEQKIHRPTFVLPPGLDYFGKHISAVDAFYLAPQDGRPGGYLFRPLTSPLELLKQPSLKKGGKTIVFTPADNPTWLKPDECFVASAIDFSQLSMGSKWRRYMSTPDLVEGLANPSLDFGAGERVLIHSRLVQPLADICLLFLGLPLVLRRETRNVFAAIGLCVALTVVFMLVGMACQYLGSVVYIRPSLAAWLPLLIFVPLAMALYDRIDK